MAGSFLAFALYLCEPPVNLNHKEGGSAKDHKTPWVPPSRAPLSPAGRRLLILEVGRFTP